MKTFLVFTFSVFFSLQMHGQDILLKSIKKENMVKDTFYFHVVNNSTADKVYSVSLEKWMNNQGWQEIKGDVFTSTSTKKIRVFTIKARKASIRFLHPNKIVVDKNKFNKYRLKVTYGSTVIDKSNFTHSNAFFFKN